MRNPLNRTQLVSFAVAFSSQSITAMMVYLVPSLAPVLKASLGISTAAIGEIVGVSWIGVVTTSMVLGTYGDQVGVRKVLFVAHVIQAASLVLAYVAQTSYVGILLSFFGVGVGYSAVTPLTSKMIVDSFPPDQAASVMGFKQSGVVVGTTLAGIIFPTASLLYGYATGFLLAALIVMVSAVNLLFYKENVSSPRREKPSLLRSLRASFSHRRIVSLGLMGILFAAVQAATLGYTTLFLQGRLNFSPVLAGYVLSLVSIMGILSRPFFGLISAKFFDRNGMKTLFLVALTSAVSLLFVSLLGTGTPFWALLVVMSALGFGALGWNAVFLSYAGEMSAKGSVAMGTSTAFAIAMLGQVVGAPVFGVIVDSSWGFTGAWQTYALGIFAASIASLLLARAWNNKPAASEYMPTAN